MNGVGDAIFALLLAAAYAAQMARWLRVLQREHYDPRSMAHFLGRWTTPQVPSAKSLGPWRGRAAERRPFTLSHALIVAILVSLALRASGALVVTSAAYGLFCPQGLHVRGTTGKLAWTRRLRTVTLVAFVVAAVVAGVGALTPQPFLGAVVVVLAVPPVLDVATRVLGPYEERRARRYVDQAVRRLAAVHPRIVAITGSYGKTSTKNHLSQLLAGVLAVVASPRSYNNRAGLSRAINENLVDGTQVFVAEMGTYGPGEIRDLTSWCVPEVAVVTAIGPVHLERMGTLEVIEAAKREITERAATVVLNVDDGRLARWPDSLRAAGKRVITAGSLAATDVRVAPAAGEWSIVLDGQERVRVAAIVGVQPTNLACALGAARALGVDDDTLVRGLGRVEPVANRLQVATAPSGVVVIDDTFNANPASALAALDALSALAVPGRRVVVTPGLVELGREQHTENLKLGRRAEALGDELVVVKRSNALALEAGYGKPARRFDSREEAVAWVRGSLGSGDAVLYLNDLPDHYP
jgi:UDP-N-acetylmuramoyl-tripeptide--D-alanyl-D-alanine ligase